MSLQERMTRGTLTSTMRRASHPSECARCVAVAVGSAIKHQCLATWYLTPSETSNKIHDYPCTDLGRPNPAHQLENSDGDRFMGWVMREQKMLKGYLPRVIHHQVYSHTQIKIPDKNNNLREGVWTVRNLSRCSGPAKACLRRSVRLFLRY